jgi:hypothetical protein
MEISMLKNFALCLVLSVAASATQQSCNAKADECKEPVANPRPYPEQHCTCVTCEKGTPNEKILCTNDEGEAQKLEARISGSEAPPLKEPLEKKEVAAAEKGKSMTLTGWVKDEGGKTVFENDKDKQSWDIANADTVKGHEGHHVKVKAKLDEANHSVTVDKLTMLRKGKQSAEGQKNAEKK